MNRIPAETCHPDEIASSTQPPRNRSFLYQARPMISPSPASARRAGPKAIALRQARVRPWRASLAQQTFALSISTAGKLFTPSFTLHGFPLANPVGSRW